MKANLLSFIEASVCLALLLFNSSVADSQALQKEYYKMDYADRMVFNPGNSEVAPFYISSKPVTNREYILYLVWNYRIFVDYPEVLYAALPGIKSDSTGNQSTSPFSDSTSFSNYLNSAESFVGDYIFNPKYLDSPVIGISWQQANNYCHWVSDRYNEYAFLNKKYLLFDPNQVNEDNFTTETFIFWQYEGREGKTLPFDRHANPSGFGFVNYMLRPAFHIATKYELELYAKPEMPVDTRKITFVYEVTTVDGSPFLRPFYDNFLPENRKGDIFITSDMMEGQLYLSRQNSVEITSIPKELNEWCFDTYLPDKEKSITDIYCKTGYKTASYKEFIERDTTGMPKIEKNRFGRLPFIITGENQAKEFEIVKGVDIQYNKKESDPCYIFDNSTKTVVNRKGDVYTSFRYSVNALKK
jgi:hypothetical protein